MQRTVLHFEESLISYINFKYPTGRPFMYMMYMGSVSNDLSSGLDLSLYKNTKTLITHVERSRNTTTV